MIRTRSCGDPVEQSRDGVVAHGHPPQIARFQSLAQPAAPASLQARPLPRRARRPRAGRGGGRGGAGGAAVRRPRRAASPAWRCSRSPAATVLARLGRFHPHPRFGLANGITLVRAGGAAVFAALALEPELLADAARGLGRLRRRRAAAGARRARRARGPAPAARLGLRRPLRHGGGRPAHPRARGGGARARQGRAVDPRPRPDALRLRARRARGPGARPAAAALDAGAGRSARCRWRRSACCWRRRWCRRWRRRWRRSPSPRSPARSRSTSPGCCGGRGERRPRQPRRPGALARHLPGAAVEHRRGSPASTAASSAPATSPSTSAPTSATGRGRCCGPGRGWWRSSRSGCSTPSSAATCRPR